MASGTILFSGKHDAEEPRAQGNGSLKLRDAAPPARSAAMGRALQTLDS
jgi:hypothetical protein